MSAGDGEPLSQEPQLHVLSLTPTPLPHPPSGTPGHS